MAEDKHPGITMHKLPIGGGFMGLLFVVGSALIFVIGFPTLWYFVALALLLGIGIAALMRYVRQGHSENNKPLSILNPEDNPAEVSEIRHRRTHLLQASGALS